MKKNNRTMNALKWSAAVIGSGAVAYVCSSTVMELAFKHGIGGVASKALLATVAGVATTDVVWTKTYDALSQSFGVYEEN